MMMIYIQLQTFKILKAKIPEKTEKTEKKKIKKNIVIY